MEQKLTQYIVEKYKPLAVLLHGSRASGNERIHSDWDFAITFKPTSVEVFHLGKHGTCKKLLASFNLK